MLQKIVMRISIALTLSVALATALGAGATHSITVKLDETTQGDLDLVAATLESTAPGAEVQRSLRRLTTSAAGELALLAGQRVDASGNLTLDSGALAALAPDDEVVASAAGEPQVEYVDGNGATIRAPRRRVILIPQPCAGTSCSMKPYAILITTNSGCRRVLLFAHPPVVGVC
jgi:hypothetical protein